MSVPFIAPDLLSRIMEQQKPQPVPAKAANPAAWALDYFGLTPALRRKS